MARFILILLLVLFGNAVLYIARLHVKVREDVNPSPSDNLLEKVKYFDRQVIQILSPSKASEALFSVESTATRLQFGAKKCRMARATIARHPHDWLDPGLGKSTFLI